MAATEIQKLSSIDATKLLIHDGLYVEYDVTSLDKEHLLRFQYFLATVDAYCVHCQSDSVFHGLPDLGVPFNSKPGMRKKLEDLIHNSPDDFAFLNKPFSIVLQCSRDANHLNIYHFLLKDRSLRKIGQYPSLADVQFPRLKKYNKVLSTQLRGELARAIGLHAHGVGVGAFVYLRRIFEKLLDQAYNRARVRPTWDDTVYEKSRVIERIKLLSSDLPKSLVDNVGIYSILSKGIHELRDDECLRHFEVMRLGIEMILDEEVERQDKAQRESALNSQISKLKATLT